MPKINSVKKKFANAHDHGHKAVKLYTTIDATVAPLTWGKDLNLLPPDPEI